MALVVVLRVVVCVPVVSGPVEVEVEIELDVDADAPDVLGEPGVEDAPSVPEDEVEVDSPEEDVFDGVVEPLPLLVVAAAEPVVVAETGGILIGTLTDEHADVTAFETED